MTQKLLAPITVGSAQLKHRVVMAPLTRMRSDDGDMPNDLMAEYYEQRSSEGGLIISEAATVSLRGRAYLGAPGIYNAEQVSAWKKITSAVHSKGGKIFLQIWHGGRQSHPDNEPNYELPIGPSAISGQGAAHTSSGWKDVGVPRALELNEIPGVIDEFRTGAERAIEAGFDGVEIHAANGYLPDQFLQDGANLRTDAYGGPIEHRARFLLEVTSAVVHAIGAGRVGVRISPSSIACGIFDSNPAATFSYVAKELNKFGLAYLHVVEPRVVGDSSIDEAAKAVAAASLRPLYKGTIVAAGGFTPESAEEIIRSGDADLVAFGRSFIANPDLPERIRAGLPFNPYHRDTFYGGNAVGYVDYPFYKPNVKETA